MGTTLLIVGILVLLIVGYIVIYNGIVTKRNQADNAFSQVEVQLKRKGSLIPTLVDTLKMELGHESEVLIKVTEARASLNRATGPAEMAKADHQLNTSVNALVTFVNENYPTLASHQTFMQFNEEYTSTENRVTYARQAFNDAVTLYHNAMDTFPGFIVAGRFARKQLFEMPAEERAAYDQAIRVL